MHALAPAKGRHHAHQQRWRKFDDRKYMTWVVCGRVRKGRDRQTPQMTKTYLFDVAMQVAELKARRFPQMVWWVQEVKSAN